MTPEEWAEELNLFERLVIAENHSIDARYCALCDQRDPRKPSERFSDPRWNWTCQEHTKALLAALDVPQLAIDPANPERVRTVNRLREMLPDIPWGEPITLGEHLSSRSEGGFKRPASSVAGALPSSKHRPGGAAG